MTVRREGNRIVLEGRCPVADAEALLLALRETPHAVLDVGCVQRLHMAVLQILLAARPTVIGSPDAPFLSRNIFGALISNSDSAPDFP